MHRLILTVLFYATTTCSTLTTHDISQCSYNINEHYIIKLSSQGIKIRNSKIHLFVNINKLGFLVAPIFRELNFPIALSLNDPDGLVIYSGAVIRRINKNIAQIQSTAVYKVNDSSAILLNTNIDRWSEENLIMIDSELRLSTSRDSHFRFEQHTEPAEPKIHLPPILSRSLSLEEARLMDLKRRHERLQIRAFHDQNKQFAAVKKGVEIIIRRILKGGIFDSATGVTQFVHNNTLHYHAKSVVGCYAGKKTVFYDIYERINIGKL